MTSNLVPKVITDKNGVITTRWVAPDEAQSSAKRPLPSPMATVSAISSKPSRTDLLTGIYGALSDNRDDDVFDVDEITGTVKHLEDKTLEVISDYLFSEGSYVDPERVYKVTEALTVGYENERQIREVTVFSDSFGEDTHPLFIDNAIELLHRCVDLPHMDDYSQADEDIKQQARRILKTAENLYEDSFIVPARRNMELSMQAHLGGRMVLSEGLRTLIKENPDQRESIIKIMDERETEDADLIRSIINSESSAISSGIL